MGVIGWNKARHSGWFAAFFPFAAILLERPCCFGALLPPVRDGDSACGGELCAPSANVESLLDSLFSGMVTVKSGTLSGRAVVATTTLDLRALLERFQDVDLEPVHIRRGLDVTKTEFRNRPVQPHTETNRITRKVHAHTQELVAPN